MAWAAGALTYVVARFHSGSLGVAGTMAADRLGIDATLLSLFSAVQLGVFAATQVPVGLLVDRYAPRKLLTLSLTVMAGGLAAAPPLSAALRAFGWKPVFFSVALATSCLIVAVWLGVRDAPPDALRSGRSGSPGETLRAALAEAWRQPATRVGLWLMFTVHFPVQVFVLLWGFPFLTQGQGLSATTASYVTAVPLVVTMALGPVFGVISGRRPHLRIPLVLVIVGATSVMWGLVLLWPGAQTPLPVLFLLAIVLGLGNPAAVFGLDIARSGSPMHPFGAATGIANIGGYTAALLAMMLIGVTLDRAHATSADPGVADFRLALATQFLLQALGVVLLLRLLRRRRAGSGPSPVCVSDTSADGPSPVGPQ
ncbi:MFS transporter [Streptomyces sp. N2A]|uniref:MFS transporter n=1 Tax=Streptomyces sp. N2A TaxID=3073936 RepID=UPI0028704A05|nr:MFS transporter [Streptomyces sp. N2A]